MQETKRRGRGREREREIGPKKTEFNKYESK